MSRPVDWSPLAGSDPVPGDPERVEELGRHYLRVAWAIRDCEAKLRRIVDHPDMQSEAVAAFRDTGREVAEDIGRAFERYDGVGRALIGYAPVQRDAQFESAAALHQAKDAEAELASASRLVDAAQSRVNAAAAAGADTTVELGDYRRAVAAADAAGEALAAARRRLAGAVEDRDRAAGRAMGLVQEVRDSGDLNDTWWDNWGAKVVKVIVKIADWVATIAGVLALVLAWVPILGPALAALALIASVVSLLGNLALAATGNGEWSDALWSALGVAAFGVGRVAMRGFRVAAGGVRGASRLAAGRVAAGSPAARAAAGLPDSSSAIKAIKAMLHMDDPMSVNAARRLAKTAREWGGKEIWAAARVIPGKVGHDLAAVRTANWGEVWHQASQNASDIGQAVRHKEWESALMRVWGEPGAAEDVKDIKGIHSAVRGSDEVAPHMRRAIGYGVSFGAGTVYGGYDVYRTGSHLPASPSPAEQLHLPPHQVAGAGGER